VCPLARHDRLLKSISLLCLYVERGTAKTTSDGDFFGGRRRKTKVRADAIAEKQQKMMPAKTGRYGELSLGGLAPQKRRNVQIVAGNFPRDFADVFLDLLNDVAMEGRFGARCRSHSCWSSVPFFAARFPGTRHELRTLRCIFLVGFLEARGDNVIFTASFMVSSCTAPKIMLAFSAAAF